MVGIRQIVASRIQSARKKSQKERERETGDSPIPDAARERRKRRQSSLVTKKRLVLPLPIPTPPEVEDLSSTARQKWIIRNTPVTDAKYLPVWKRLKAKLKAKFFMKNLNRELQLFGASTIAVDNEELQLKVQKLARTGTLRSLTWNDIGSKMKLPCLIIPPNHWFKGAWNGMLSVLLIYTATIMPFRLAFIDEADAGGWLVLEYMVNSLFFLDFLINCFSAYYDNDGLVISDRRKIVVNYLKGWMAIDLVACIPFSLIDTGNSSTTSSGSTSVGYNSLIRLIRVPRLYRLFRISRLFKALKQTSEIGCMAKIQDFVSLKHSAMRLISFFLTVLICVHLMSCLWYFTATLEGLSPDCWVYKFDFQDKDASTLYIASFYWAFTTLTTVGYGDISANTSLERIIAVLWMMFGVCFFSFTIGSLTSMITNIDTKETVLTNKLAIIDEFARESKLDKKLRARLRHAIKYLSEKTGFSWNDKQNIFNELPKNLKYEVAMAMHQGAIKSIPFFEDKNEVFIATVVPFLLPMQATTNSFVYKENEYADEVYFLGKGRCMYVMMCDGEYTSVKKIQRGSYFGEIEILFSLPRKYTVQAITDCDLLVMSKSLLQVIHEEFTGVYRELVEIAETRDILNQRAITEVKELMKLKKTQNLTGMDLSQIKEMIKKKTEKFTPERRNSSRMTVATVDDMNNKSDRQAPSESDLLTRSNSTKDRLFDSERKLKLIKDMLNEQNQYLRTNQGTKSLAVLPPLVLPVPVLEEAKSSSGSEGSEGEGKMDTPSFKQMQAREKKDG